MKKYLIPLAFGMLGGLAFPPLHLVFFLPVAFNYVLHELPTMNYKTATAFSFGYFLVQLYWISFSLLVEIETYFWLLPFAMCLIPLACSVFLTIPLILARKLKIENKFALSLTFSFLYVFFQFIKNYIFTWNFASYTLAFSDTLIQAANILNIYVFDFLVISFCCFWFVLCDKKYRWASIYYAAILLFIVSFGVVRLQNASPVRYDRKIKLVQANIPQSLKWDRAEAFNNLQTHIDLSAGDDDIVIWAESSFPFTLDAESELKEKFNQFKNKVLITGAVRTHEDKIWNSIFVFKNNQVADFYDKYRLVAFGEYMPLPFLNTITGFRNFSRGTGNRTIMIDDDFKISPVICYEIVFPNGVINKKDRPDVIVNLTNDAWFGTSSGPYQHLVAARFRAVENGIPVIRVANSGISAYINEYGIIENRLGLWERGTVSVGESKTLTGY